MKIQNIYLLIEKASFFKIIASLILVCLSFQSQASESAPNLKPDATVKVFIQYSSSTRAKILKSFYQEPKTDSPLKNNHRSGKLKNALMSQTVFLQHELTKNASIQKIEPFWLSLASIAEVTLPMIPALKNLPYVEAVTILNRKAYLSEIAEVQLAPLWTWSPKYTYGLNKIDLPLVNQKYPQLDGLGIKVGVIDTGVDPKHPDLVGKTILFRDYIDKKNTLPRDDHGHGTHVAGTIAGGNQSGKNIGVAPAAKLVIAKSFSKTGDSNDADLLLSLQWMADPDGNPQTQDQPQVVSNSWNLDDVEYRNNEPQLEPFCLAIESLEKLGVSVVFSAGNDGVSGEDIKLPGACPQAITVAATDSGDQVPSFSSRGPVWWKNQKFNKPDISAPGYNIESADTGGGYKTRSGTSMSVPHIAGAIALLKQAAPKAGPNDLKRALYIGATDVEDKGFDIDSGNGRLSVIKALNILGL